MAELSFVLKATVVLGLGVLVARLAGRQPAALRALILTYAFGLLALLPIAPFVLPSRAIEMPADYSAALASVPLTTFAASPAPPVAPDPVRTARARSWQPSAREFLFLAWAIGVVGFAAPLFVALLRLRRMRVHARRWTDPSLPSSVRVLLHDDVKVPITCGAAPVVVLPSDAPQWTQPELRRVMIHELEHIRRRDWVVHLAARVLCAVYWFHPLVWIAWRQLRLECERACDDAVLREEDSAAYAAQLVALARRLTTGDAAPLLAIAGRSHLSARVAALLANDVARGPVRTASAVAVAVAGAIAVLGIGPLQAVAAIQKPSAPSSGLSFQTASVRRTVPLKDPENACCAVRFAADGRVSGYNVGLVNLIVSAYGVHIWQVVDEPDWAGHDTWGIEGARFDVEATTRRDASRDDKREMLKTMLADRFRLTVHRETRHEKLYELVVEPGGHKLPPPGAKPYDIEADVWLRVDPGTMTAQLLPERMTMAQLVLGLGSPLGRMVVDRTGLKGEYRVNARWNAAPGSTAIFDAFPAQLGLRLRETTGPVDYLVVDRAERPTLDRAQ